jgi:hypothetical protein
MSNLAGTAALLLIVALVLPTIARIAQAAIPLLIFLLVVTVLWRTGFPPRRRR